jgi:hypothetical protein
MPEPLGAAAPAAIPDHNPEASYSQWFSQVVDAEAVVPQAEVIEKVPLLPHGSGTSLVS